MSICLYNNILPPPSTNRRQQVCAVGYCFWQNGGIQKRVLAIIFPVHESFFDDRFVYKYPKSDIFWLGKNKFD